MSVQLQFKETVPPFRLDEAGGIRIAESRVTLDSVLAAYHSGATPEEISIQYSVLQLSDIYATIAYYLSNNTQIDSYLENRRLEADERRQQLLQKNNLGDFRARLSARKSSQDSD